MVPGVALEGSLMEAVWTCLTQEHDPRLVGLAAVICLAGALVGLSVLRRALGATSHSRAGWLIMSGLSTGATVWCTHFVAMLAYAPAGRLGFHPLMTLASLLVAIAMAALGFSLAISRVPAAAWLGGGVVGAGISAMHYIGMAAFGDGGIPGYDMTLVAASVLMALLFSMAAVPLALHAASWSGHMGGVAVFCLAVVSLHFTGMGAVSLLPPPVVQQDSATGQAVLALAIGLVALMVVAATAAAWLIDRHGHAESLVRLRRLADSAIEGLAVIQNGRIVEANGSLQAMTGLSRLQLLGRTMEGEMLPSLRLPEMFGEVMLEAQLRRADGSLMDVELVVRDNVPQPGKRVFALRDLRERREQERRLNHLAAHDGLTGLANRAGFAHRIARQLRDAAASGQRLALLRIGLNRFNEVNDLFGHAAGDRLLKGYAAALKGMAQPQGLPARLGGDEFALLLPFAELHEVEALVQAVSGIEPSGPVALSAAIGVALFPDDAADAEALLANADVAMRRAKSPHASGACFYQADMDAAVRERRRLVSDLRQALKAGQLSLFYQPQIATGVGRLCGHEALMRWQHPSRGFVSPADFIPLAEETGLILPLGEWALRTACAAAAAEPRLGKVAVNLSPVQFRQAGLAVLVADTLVETGLPPDRLELEITESTLMQDPGRTLEVLRAIKALGVSVAMDDFGTGHSSLATLRAFPFDKIKLDRSFVPEIDSNPQARAILRAVVGIGRGLGIPILAEGVETPSELACLRDEGCAEVQGYLIGRPAPLAALNLSEPAVAA
jgi:diguanylate cyclase (GGDEF)-like protein/PAS domain S-box-containing protein